MAKGIQALAEAPGGTDIGPVRVRDVANLGQASGVPPRAATDHNVEGAGSRPDAGDRPCLGDPHGEGPDPRLAQIATERGRMLAIAALAGVPPHAVEDCVQETWLIVIRNGIPDDGRDPVGHAIGVLRNVVRVDHRRRMRARERLVPIGDPAEERGDPDAVPDPEDPRPRPDEQSVSRERQSAVQGYLATLPETDRRALIALAEENAPRGKCARLVSSAGRALRFVRG